MKFENFNKNNEARIGGERVRLNMSIIDELSENTGNG